MIRDLIVLISENQRIFLKKCPRKDKSFKPFTEFYQTTIENGISREITVFTGEKGFHGRERDFTGENGISRERNGNSRKRTGESGVSRDQRTGFHGRAWYYHGKEQDFTGENGILQEKTGFYGSERDLTGENRILR